MKLTTPAGNPTSSQRRAANIVVSGEYSEGLSTTALPAYSRRWSTRKFTVMIICVQLLVGR